MATVADAHASSSGGPPEWLASAFLHLARWVDGGATVRHHAERECAATVSLKSATVLAQSMHSVSTLFADLVWTIEFAAAVALLWWYRDIAIRLMNAAGEAAVARWQSRRQSRFVSSAAEWERTRGKPTDPPPPAATAAEEDLTTPSPLTPHSASMMSDGSPLMRNRTADPHVPPHAAAPSPSERSPAYPEGLRIQQLEAEVASLTQRLASVTSTLDATVAERDAAADAKLRTIAIANSAVEQLAAAEAQVDDLTKRLSASVQYAAALERQVVALSNRL